MYAFVDGAVDLNRRRDQGGAGFGGAGVVLVRTRGKHVVSYRIIGVPFWPHSIFITNNTMEVMAVQVACNAWREALAAGRDIQIWTDSAYAKGMLSFGSSWVAEKNRALIEFVRRSTAKSNVIFHHIKGHAGFAWNELADTAAGKAVEHKRGFDKTYPCSICELCFRCRKFPCQQKGFGTKTSRLLSPDGYAGFLDCIEFRSAKLVESLET